MFAILDDLGFQELFVIMIAAVLFFGKRLPDVAAQAGAQFAKFKRSLQDLKTETGVDQEVRKLQRTLEDVIPRDISLQDMARAASAKIEERRRATEAEIRASLSSEPTPAAETPPPRVEPTIEPVVDGELPRTPPSAPPTHGEHGPELGGSIPRAG